MLPRVNIKGDGGIKQSNEIEIMQNIAFIIKESGMGFCEVMDLPYTVFLSLLKHFQVFKLQQNPEYCKALEEQKILGETEPDMGRLRRL